MSEWKSADRPPADGLEVIATDGRWMAIGFFDEGGSEFVVNHFAVSQEYKWEPTHWTQKPQQPEAGHE